MGEEGVAGYVHFIHLSLGSGRPVRYIHTMFFVFFSLFLTLAADYDPLPSATLSFLEGAVNGTQACMNISIVDDMAFEKNETFLVNITVVEDNIDILEPSSIPVTIVDNEGKLV